MEFDTKAIVALLRRSINCGSVLRAHPFTWNTEELFPIFAQTSKLWRLNSVLFLCYTVYLGVKLWHFAACKQNLVGLISIVFLFLFYAYGCVLQLTVINEKGDILGFIRKLCVLMKPKAEPNGAVKATQLIGICEKIMAVTFYATLMNAVIVASTAAYQLDASELVGKGSLGGTMRTILRISFVVLYAHVGYIVWSLTSFLALLFFALAFTVMAALSELKM